MEHSVRKVKNHDGTYSTVYIYNNEYIDSLFDINTQDTPVSHGSSQTTKQIEYISKDIKVPQVTQNSPDRYNKMIEELFKQ